MTSLIITLANVAVSFVYPLSSTYQLLISNQQDSQIAKHIVESLSGTVTISSDQMVQYQECIAYWCIVAVSHFIGSISVVSFTLSMIPFTSLVGLYLRIWLVFPIIPHRDDNGETTKVTGTHVIYERYFMRSLRKLSLSFDDFTSYSVSIYNNLIDRYMPPAGFLKITRIDAQGQRQTSVLLTPPSRVASNTTRQASEVISGIMGGKSNDDNKGSLSELSGYIFLPLNTFASMFYGKRANAKKPEKIEQVPEKPPAATAVDGFDVINKEDVKETKEDDVAEQPIGTSTATSDGNIYSSAQSRLSWIFGRR